MTLSIASPTRLAVALWLVVLILAGAWLRVHGVNDYYYSVDELGHVAMAKGESAQEVTQFSTFETHPPYPNILRHYWLMLGDTPWIIRGLSVIAGLLCIPVYYAVGRQMGGALAGCIAAYLVTFSYGNIMLSQVVRNYTMLALILGVTAYFYHVFLQTRKYACLLGYAVAAQLALMTHYSAVFAVFVMGGMGFFILLRGEKKRLLLWIAVHVLLAGYFGGVYISAIRHNAYAEMFALNTQIIAQSQQYGSLGFRIALIVAYLPATASYFLHSGFASQLNYPSAILFLYALVWMGMDSARRVPFYETAAALLLGAVLLATDTYPYEFKIAGRHAVWMMPYILLPVSLFLAHVARRSRESLAEYTAQGGVLAAMAAAALVAAGIAVNPPSLFLSDLREYQLTTTQDEQLKTFLGSLGKRDVILTAGLNVMYLLPDDANYYRQLSQAQGRPWYYTSSTGRTRIIHIRQYPPIIDGRFVTIKEFVARLEKAGELSETDTIWFFNTDIFPMTSDAEDCKGLEKKTVIYPQLLSRMTGSDFPVAEFVGISKQTLMKDILPQSGKYASCLLMNKDE